MPGTTLLCCGEEKDKASQQRGTNQPHSRTRILFRREVTCDRPTAFAAWTAVECPLGRRSKPVDTDLLLALLTGTTPDSVYSKSTPQGVGCLHHKAKKTTNYSICKSKDELHQDPPATQNLRIL